MNDWVTTQKEELRSDFLKLVLYELNNAISPKEKRAAALQAAIEEFNHDNCHKHDQELELQADKILFQKISYCFTVHKHDEEMGLLACALEMVYRASRGRVALSFQEVQDSILPLFVEMLRRSSVRRKHIVRIRDSQIQEAASSAPQENNDGEGTVVSVGTFYKKGIKGEDMGTHHVNMNADTTEHLNGHFHPEHSNDNSSLVSILKTEPLEVPSTPVASTPVASTPVANNLRPVLLDELPEDMSTEFTIECIPNGTEIRSFPLEAHIKEEKVEDDNLKNTVRKIDGEPQDNSTGTVTTSNSDGTHNSPLHGDKKNSPSEVGSFPDSRINRQRQVRFSDKVQSNEVLFGPQTKVKPNSTWEQDDYVPSTEAQNSNIEKQTVLKKERYTHALAVLKVLTILRYFSRVLSAMVPMAHFPGLLDELIFQMRIRKSGVDGMDGILRKRQSAKTEIDDDLNSFKSAKSMESSESKQKSSQYLDNASAARMDTIAIIVNLACAEENKVKLLRHPGLLDAVIHVAEHDVIDNAREHASIVLMNLALAEENKVAMASYDDFLYVLLNLVTDEVINTRRYASSTILNLVGTPKNTHRIASFGKGKLLHVLTRVLALDDVEEVRINVAETFFNLVKNSNDLRTIELIGRHRDALTSLASTVISDYSADVRAYSARTLEWLAADIHFGSQSHPGLLDALTEASQWTKTNCIAEALKAQASMEENRIAMVERPGMLDALSSLAALHGVNDEEVRECALAAIERLTNEPYVRKTMAMHEGIMTELTRATFSTNNILDQYEEHDKVTRTLMKSALKNLANEI